jgi:LPXTG-site transpeptidase (sortase) family protein
VLNFFRVVPKKRKIRVNKSSGLLYSNPPAPKRVIFYLGNILLLGALIYGGYLYAPFLQAFYNYKFTKAETKVETIAEQKIEIKKSDEFFIQIPKILAFSKVVENVSPFDQAEYLKVLKQNLVAHSKDSDSPGSGLGKMTYVFAHSSTREIEDIRNNAVFYLLGELELNDFIYIKYHGQEYKYRIYDKKVVKANQVEFLNYNDENKELLILQTCWPIGTDWNRLLIFAELTQ